MQFIDFEGRSDGESLLKILSQLRPRQVVVVRGSPDNINIVAKHCKQNIGARVFTPNKGDIVDATTETHIYQVRLTESLVSQLYFQKGKDAEVAWIDSKVVVRNKQIDTGINNMEIDGDNDRPSDDGIFLLLRLNWSINTKLISKILIFLVEEKQILTLEPLDENDIPPHNSVLINELKLSDFKQILSKNNINAEFSGGVLWCSNGTLALRRVRYFFK